MKACPFCAEEIQDAAIVCKHCGRDLVATPPVAGRPITRKGERKRPLWFGWLVALSCLVFAGFCVRLLETPQPESQHTTNIATITPTRETAPSPSPRKSPSCGIVSGDTQKDVDNLIRFCDSSVAKSLQVSSARAAQSLLWLQVSREIAELFRTDRLSGEQLVKTFMNVWRQRSGSHTVTVYIQWQDVDIAKGESSIFSGDTVTIK